MLGEDVPAALLGDRRQVDEGLVKAVRLAVLVEDTEGVRECPAEAVRGVLFVGKATATRQMSPVISRAACGIDDAVDGAAADHADIAGILDIHQEVELFGQRT